MLLPYVPNKNIPMIEEILAEEIARILYFADPMHTGSVENELFDEYATISHSIASDFMSYQDSELGDVNIGKDRMLKHAIKVNFKTSFDSTVKESELVYIYNTIVNEMVWIESNLSEEMDGTEVQEVYLELNTLVQA